MTRRIGSKLPNILLLGAALAVAPAFAQDPGGATATLADAAGQTMGSVTFKQVPEGLQLIVDATGLPSGVHGLHIHSTGKCEGPAFATAGGHWNPTMKTHGKDAPGGMHEGDLPNLVVADDGTGHVAAMIRGAMLSGGDHPLLDEDGAAVVIHADADDYRTDPSGNSGARIACGVIMPA